MRNTIKNINNFMLILIPFPKILNGNTRTGTYNIGYYNCKFEKFGKKDLPITIFNIIQMIVKP